MSSRSTTDATIAPPDAGVHDRLHAAGALFAVAVVVHNGDHVRRGADALALDVFSLGTAAIALEVTLVVLICGRHRLAPVGAAVAGFTLAAGYLFVHFLPARSWLSDPLLPSRGVDRWSVTAALLEVVAALVLGLVGLSVLRRLGGLAAATIASAESRTRRVATLHPLALAFTLSQVATVALSFAQR